MAIQLIVTSVRDARVGGDVATRIAPTIAEGAGRAVEIVDLKDVDLPLLNEPEIPGMGNYQLDTTKRWAEFVLAADGFVWLTPEYNGGFTASAKNAIDTILAEWEGKPAGVVGYGFGGAGRSIPMLQTIMGNVKMDVIDESVQMPFGDAMGDEGLDVDALVAGHEEELRELGQRLAERIAA